jgi:hypothetical protein
MNQNQYQNMKENAGLLGSLSCGLLMLSPMIVILRRVSLNVGYWGIIAKGGKNV